MIYLPPSLHGFTARHIVFSTWMDHLCFGYDLVAALEPPVIVELGTQGGLSYFCLCQSVEENGVTARCFAVDTWAGDAHTGTYDDRFFRLVSEHNAAHYASFSTLLRMRFDEALTQFEAESIGLLHIDGYHTYEAVRSDFEAWWPKVMPGGVVLFHDIAARLMDFGVWRFWSEVERQFESFTFRHGFGLGVLRKPGPRPDVPLLQLLFEGTRPDREALRAFYVHASEHQDLLRKKALRDRLAAERR